MKVNELIPGDVDLEEGWKDTLTNLGMAAAIAGGTTGTLMTKQGIEDYLSKKKQDSTQSRTVIDKIKDQDHEIENLPKLKKEPVETAPLVTGSPHETFLKKVAVNRGMSGSELAAFLSQTAHESHNFRSMVEYGSKSYFNMYDPKFNPRKAQELGNKKAGDGERYKGRGYIQITGRYNYRKAGEALGLPLEENPELAEQPEVAARIALWYWKSQVRPRVRDFSDVTAVTKTINPGLRGLEKRDNLFQNFLIALDKRGNNETN